MASRATTRTRSGPRRKLVWVRTSAQSTSVAAAGAGFFDLLGPFEALYGARLLGSTVMRIRGTIAFNSTIVDQVVPSVVGVKVYDRNEFASLAVTNGPAGDPGADWMMYDALYPQYTVGTTTLAGAIHVDVRSRRKIEEVGQSLLLAYTNTGTSVRVHTASLSVLVALP